MRKTIALAALALCGSAFAAADAEWNFDRPHWVPMPFECQVTSNVCVRLDDAQTVRVRCPEAGAADWVRGKTKEMLNVSPKVTADAVASQPEIPGGPEAYRVTADESGITLSANTLAGVHWAFYTLRQALIPERGVVEFKSWILPKMEVTDAPKLKFRGIHVCWFPETKAWEIERAIRVAAYYKLNYLVLEDWGVFESKKYPWMSWPNPPMTQKELKRLVALGKDLGVTLVPQINAFGHASQSRRGVDKHAVLDLNPQYASLFEPHGGWVWCLTSEAARNVLKDMVAELHEAFGKPPYFHLGCDESDEPSCPRCRASDWTATVGAHLRDMRDFLAARGARMMVWHDMFVGMNDPRFAKRNRKSFYANGGAEAERLLDLLPKDVIVCDWWYDGKSPDGTHLTMDHFRAKGHDVVPCPWDNWEGGLDLGDYAVKHNLFGILGTTWHRMYRGGIRIEFLVAAFASWGAKDPEQWSDFGSHLRDIVHDMKVTDPRQTGYAHEQMPSTTTSAW